MHSIQDAACHVIVMTTHQRLSRAAIVGYIYTAVLHDNHMQATWRESDWCNRIQKCHVSKPPQKAVTHTAFHISEAHTCCFSEVSVVLPLPSGYLWRNIATRKKWGERERDRLTYHSKSGHLCRWWRQETKELQREESPRHTVGSIGTQLCDDHYQYIRKETLETKLDLLLWHTTDSRINFVRLNKINVFTHTHTPW